jgi:SAM-dependent methyltransferase
MNVAGSEITADIVKILAASFPDADLRVGTCACLPWPEATFDYLLSWNSCYYMNTGATFKDHVVEMMRVLKPGGFIVCSVPKADCFIFRNCETIDGQYVTILDEHFGLRNGEVMRRFLFVEELEYVFSPYFTDFCHASIDIDMFGLAYNWHVFTAKKKTP